jgi:hypothetical protein
MHRRAPSLTVVLVLLHVGHANVHAQELAGTFDQLRVLVKPGDKITVTDDTGREMSGRIAELSPSSLALIVDDNRRDRQATEINTIRQRRSDSLANGAKWGFGIGAGLGLLAGLAVFSDYEEGNNGALIFFLTLTYGGIGAGVGTGVDALIAGNQVIYARRIASSARITVQPRLTRQRQGAVLTIGF